MEAIVSRAHAPQINVINGVPSVLSTNVADVFERSHSNVLKAIGNILETLPEERRFNFEQIEIERPSNLGRGVVKTKAYRLTRDGFVFLTMGFTGAKADTFKWAYIDEFNRMEKALNPAPAECETICSAEQLAIRTAVAKRAKNVAVDYRTIYRALYERFQIARYSDLPHDQLNEALRFIAQFELRPQIETQPAASTPAPRVFAPKAEKLPDGWALISPREAHVFLNLLYVVRYLFRPQYLVFDEFLQMVKSPMRGAFWDAFNDLSFTLMEQCLERHGYRVDDLAGFQRWSLTQSR